MSKYLHDVASCIALCVQKQSDATSEWHKNKPDAAVYSALVAYLAKDADILPAPGESCSLDEQEILTNLILHEHFSNFQLWHVEDQARRRDTSDSFIADCKRKIDALNQQRNNGIELVDTFLNARFIHCIPEATTVRYNTETLGMAIDRASILALKVYHMQEQAQRTDADETHTAACAQKLAILQEQREHLLHSIKELIEEYATGYKQPVMYRQFKMYNDPKLNPQLYAQVKED